MQQPVLDSLKLFDNTQVVIFYAKSSSYIMYRIEHKLDKNYLCYFCYHFEIQPNLRFLLL